MMTVAPFGGTTRNASPRSALRVQECCASCRRPVALCSHSGCQEAGRYLGTLLRGEWQEADASAVSHSGGSMRASAPAETGARLSL